MAFNQKHKIMENLTGNLQTNRLDDGGWTLFLIPILIIILIMLPGREEAVLAVFCSIGMTMFTMIFQNPYSTVS